MKARPGVKNVAPGSRSASAGTGCSDRGEALNTVGTEVRMLQRVMPEQMGMKNMLAKRTAAVARNREKTCKAI